MINLISELPRLIGFLNTRPNIDEFSRKLVLDFFYPIGINYLGVFSLFEIGRLKPIAEQGNSNGRYSTLVDLESTFQHKNIISGLGVNNLLTSPDKKMACSSISNGKNDLGLITTEFSQPLSTEMTTPFQIFMGIGSYYLYPKIQQVVEPGKQSYLSINPLTPRQQRVLHGFIEGKTNHELALELGFSISTIRHETMAIFKILGASDRREAAKIAQELSLI